jgi:MFS family permease
LLATICAVWVNEPQRGQVLSSDTKPATLKEIAKLLVSPPLRIPSLVLLLIGFGFGAVHTFIPLLIRESGVDLNAGWFFTVAAMASFMVRLVTGRGSDRYGRGLFITGSLIVYGVSIFLISIAQSPQSFLLVGFLEGAGSGALLPIMIALISDRSFSHQRGQVFAISISGLDLGIAIAGSILGSLFEQIGYSGIFLVTTFIMLLAIIIFITQSSKDLSHSWRFATGREPDIYAVEEGLGNRV